MRTSGQRALSYELTEHTGSHHRHIEEHLVRLQHNTLGRNSDLTNDRPKTYVEEQRVAVSVADASSKGEPNRWEGFSHLGDEACNFKRYR